MAAPNYPTLRTEPIGDENALPNRRHKGRGSVSNRTSGRFDAPDRYDIDDGWTVEENDALDRRKTVPGIDPARPPASYFEIKGCGRPSLSAKSYCVSPADVLASEN